jgi:hypothetical protein
MDYPANRGRRRRLFGVTHVTKRKKANIRIRIDVSVALCILAVAEILKALL